MAGFPRCSHNEEGGDSVKYLCLAYEREEDLNALSRNEWEKLRKDTLA